MSAPRLTLKPGRERSLLRRHPWVFSGAIGEVQGSPQSGANVEVRAADGAFLAWAAYSPASQIRARVWSFDEADVPGPQLFGKKIEAALALRRAAIPVQASDALRLVHGESDGLPGLIADRYADVLVVQILSAGCERWREPLIEILRDASGCARVYERSDTGARELEGLAPRAGAVSGAEPDGPIRILEHEIKYEVDVVSGQKTGFYLDQRDNRRRVGLLAAGREVLNCFCYTGGFSLSALSGGARSVLSVDSSAPALELARRNLALNGLEAGRSDWLEADVFRALRKLRDEGRQFDLMVLDPPKFAPTPKDAARAARGYKDINLNALRLLRPGGLLATFSCSGGVSPELFQKIVAGAAADAGASLVLRERFSAAPDHPVLVEFPEGEYLKGLLLERR
ncbi:MAG: class I SAM-dependent rRNA methyltransferase [Betaproteobacteria bacterium]|nr:MAG: class I SAM-dependent rRNA methyltransferase [Betaproteobacteria bacterium]